PERLEDTVAQGVRRNTRPFVAMAGGRELRIDPVVSRREEVDPARIEPDRDDRLGLLPKERLDGMEQVPGILQRLHVGKVEATCQAYAPIGWRQARHDAMNGTNDEPRIPGWNDRGHREARRVVLGDGPLTLNKAVLVVDLRLVTVVPVGD